MVNEIEVSCIILSNLNDKFVKQRTIPNLLLSSLNHSIEIIVVDNSPEHNFNKNYPEGLNNVKVIKSEPFHIPKAYNLGVKESSGKYIAIFHDDCEVRDVDWITKMTRVLNDTVYAVSPQLHHQPTKSNDSLYNTPSLHDKKNYQKFLKECPLVMEREKFYEVGGYDETYYFGYEDVRFAESINKLGKHIQEVDIEFNHYNGMSTVLMAYLNDEAFNDYRDMFPDIESKQMFREIFNEDKVKKYFNKLVGFNWPSNELIEKTWQECEKDMPKTEEELNRFMRSL